jgi:hypothetical protein
MMFKWFVYGVPIFYTVITTYGSGGTSVADASLSVQKDLLNQVKGELNDEGQ